MGAPPLRRFVSIPSVSDLSDRTSACWASIFPENRLSNTELKAQESKAIRNLRADAPPPPPPLLLLHAPNMPLPIGHTLHAFFGHTMHACFFFRSTLLLNEVTIARSLVVHGSHRHFQASWEEHGTFKETMRLSEGRPDFTFYDGPPFATGLPHYGHILAGERKVLPSLFYYGGP